MPKYYLCLLALGAVTMLGCGTSEQQTMEMEIQPYQVPCQGAGPMSCLRVVDSEMDTTEELFYDPIEGFEFEWGYRTRLRIEKYRIMNPPQDGSSIRYVSKGTVKRIAVPDWEFRSRLQDRAGWTLAGDTLLIQGFRPIRLPSQDDLGFLQAAPETGWLEFKVKQGADGMLHGHSFTVLR